MLRALLWMLPLLCLGTLGAAPLSPLSPGGREVGGEEDAPTSPLSPCGRGVGGEGNAGEKPREEKVTYLRPAGKGFTPEATFTVRRDKDGWSIESITTRGDTKMAVFARYDALDRLHSAEAALRQKEQTSTVKVEVQEGKAKVRRKD